MTEFSVGRICKSLTFGEAASQRQLVLMTTALERLTWAFCGAGGGFRAGEGTQGFAYAQQGLYH